MVGLSVTRGRLPPASSFGFPGTSTNCCARCVSGMPVSPAITLGSHAPEGVAENTMPSASIASTQVVSFAISTSSILHVRHLHLRGMLADFPVDLARQKLHATRARLICLRRSAAYSFESSTSAGMWLNFGSP